MIMSGNLSFINPQQLFQHLENNRKTVTFKVRSQDIGRLFYFLEGRIAWASSESADEQLGYWLAHRNYLPLMDVQAHLAESISRGIPFTSFLLDQGCLPPEQLAQAVEELTRHIIFKTFQENEGEFQVYAGVPEGVMAGRIRLSHQRLVIDYFQLADSLVNMR